MFSTMTAKEVSAAEAISALSIGLPMKEAKDNDGASAPVPSASPTTDSTIVTEASAAEQKESPATGDGDDEEIIMDDDDDEAGDVQGKLPSPAENETPVAAAAPVNESSSQEPSKAATDLAAAPLLKGEKGKFISNNKIKRASKYKGVGFDSKMGKWKARVHYEHKDIMVGSFETEGEAALAYDAKARQLFGEEAVTNFDRNGDWNPHAKTTIQVPKKVASGTRAIPAPLGPMLKLSLPRRRESKSPSAREPPTLPTTTTESGLTLHPDPAPSPLSSPSSLDPSRRYPKRGDGSQEGDEMLEDKPEDHTAPPATISEPPRHCLLMDPTAPTPAPQVKRKSLASGPDSRKRRKQVGSGNAELEAGSAPNVVDYDSKTGDGIPNNESASKASASSSFSSSKCGSRGRETSLVAREAAELLLGRLMDRHDAVYDRALQLFYKEKDVARAIIECVIQAYENPSPSNRLSM